MRNALTARPAARSTPHPPAPRTKVSRPAGVPWIARSNIPASECDAAYQDYVMTDDFAVYAPELAAHPDPNAPGGAAWFRRMYCAAATVVPGRNELPANATLTALSTTRRQTATGFERTVRFRITNAMDARPMGIGELRVFRTTPPASLSSATSAPLASGASVELDWNGPETGDQATQAWTFQLRSVAPDGTTTDVGAPVTAPPATGTVDTRPPATMSVAWRPEGWRREMMQEEVGGMRRIVDAVHLFFRVRNTSTTVPVPADTVLLTSYRDGMDTSEGTGVGSTVPALLPGVEAVVDVIMPFAAARAARFRARHLGGQFGLSAWMGEAAAHPMAADTEQHAPAEPAPAEGGSMRPGRAEVALGIAGAAAGILLKWYPGSGLPMPASMG